MTLGTESGGMLEYSTDNGATYVVATLEDGTPVSFDVLCNEIRGLGLNIQLEKKRGASDFDEDQDLM